MKNITPEMVSPELSIMEIYSRYGISKRTAIRYRAKFGMNRNKQRAWLRSEKMKPCPRCGARNWMAVSETVMYCRQITPGEEFSRCFYHKSKDGNS